MDLLVFFHQVYKKDSFDTDGYQMEIEDSKAIGDTDGYQMEIEDSKAIGDTDGYQMEIEDSKAIGDTDGYQMEIEDSKAIGDTDGYQMEIEDSKAIGETDGYQIEIEDSKAIKTDTEDADYFYWSPAGCYPLPPNLRTIDISNSGLFHGFTEMFCDTNNSLKVLNLANQKNFHDIDRNTLWKSLKALLQLEDLNLNGNGIQHIPSAAFTKLTNMKFLSLANNNLVVVSFEVDTLVNLKKLDLSSNNLQYVTDEFAIQIENINENQAKPEPTPFEQLPGAEQFLDYMNSHLGYEMEMENIVEITQHLFVDLRNNPLICDCERMRFVKWMRDTSLFDDKSQISRSIWQMSCTFKNGSLLQLVDAPQIYALLQQECEENIQSLGEKNKDSHNSLSLLILVAVLGLIIFGLLAVILVLLRRQRKQLGGNHDNSIVLT